MANSYTSVAFGLSITILQAQIIETAAALDCDPCFEASGEVRMAAYSATGPEFAAVFPPGDDDPFATFLALFDDADHVTFGADFETAGPGADGSISLFVAGDQADVAAIAGLLHRVLVHTSGDMQPFGFEYARTADRHQAGAFGGGQVVVTQDGIRFEDSAFQLERALAGAACSTAFDTSGSDITRGAAMPITITDRTERAAAEAAAHELLRDILGTDYSDTTLRVATDHLLSFRTRAPDHHAVDAAVTRLFDVANSDTGQAVRVARFLMAWWNGEELGHFPIADLFGLDTSIADDIATVIAWLGRHPGAVYADAFDCRSEMQHVIAMHKTGPQR